MCGLVQGTLRSREKGQVLEGEGGDWSLPCAGHHPTESLHMLWKVGTAGSELSRAEPKLQHLTSDLSTALVYWAEQELQGLTAED